MKTCSLFRSDVKWFKWRHPILWRRARRELDFEGRLYNALAGTLKAYKIPDERGPNYEDEPSYTLMCAVMTVLRREKIRI